MCLAWAYCPPAAATVEVTSESIIATQVYNNPITQHAIKAASAPPLPTAKFQPMNSPTKQIPAPSPHTCTGPSTLRRLIPRYCACDAVALMGRLPGTPSVHPRLRVN